MKRSIERLGANQSGAVAPLVAVSLFALIAVAGIAFDYARMAGMDTELQNAADQAALAAASQLDGFNATESTSGVGACARARQAALALLTNSTYFSNDGAAIAVTITDPDDLATAQCNNVGGVQFYQDKAALIPATNDAEARFVDVVVNSRRANFALTPVVSALSSGDISARARAGLGTALCKVPPLMVCDPNTSGTPDWDALKGLGLQSAAMTGKGGSWTPGGFGYLGPNDTPSTQEGLAFQNPTFSCQNVDTGEVNTGNPTPAVTAINTRFDIHDYGGGTLSACTGDTCPAALNVVKDLVRDPAGDPNTTCGIQNPSQWHLPANKFLPKPYEATDGPMTEYDADGAIDAMGLPRDNCHYSTYNQACAGGKFGNGVWGRYDYMKTYHGGIPPPNGDNTTRYETYLWEIANEKGGLPNGIPNQYVSGFAGPKQQGVPICRTDPPDPSRDRRVLTVAIGGNCPALKGASTNVSISEWVDMFFVEPGLPTNIPGGGSRGNSLDTGMEIYLEVIGKSTSGASGQVVRRDVPFLVK